MKRLLARLFGICFRDNGPVIYQFVKRDVLSRYKGSVLGVGWSVLNPILMLLLYAYAFAGILKTRWPGAEALGGVGYALNLFAGLIVFNLFSEVATRAPSSIVQHANLVKKVVFPVHVLAWVTVLSALMQLLFGCAIFLIALLFWGDGLRVSVLAFPLLMVAFVPFLLGLFWFVASVGVYVRDLSQVMGFVVSVGLFLSPIFYPISALPDYLGTVALLNPLAFIIEQSRLVLIAGQWPQWGALLVYAAVSSAFAGLGYLWFRRIQKGFADVL